MRMAARRTGELAYPPVPMITWGLNRRMRPTACRRDLPSSQIVRNQTKGPALREAPSRQKGAELVSLSG